MTTIMTINQWANDERINYSDCTIEIYDGETDELLFRGFQKEISISGLQGYIHIIKNVHYVPEMNLVDISLYRTIEFI